MRFSRKIFSPNGCPTPGPDDPNGLVKAGKLPVTLPVSYR